MVRLPIAIWFLPDKKLECNSCKNVVLMESHFLKMTSFIGVVFGVFIYYPIVRSVYVNDDWAWILPMLLFATLILFLVLSLVTVLFGRLEPDEINDE
jgi:hypothetical protein